MFLHRCRQGLVYGGAARGSDDRYTNPMLRTHAGSTSGTLIALDCCGLTALSVILGFHVVASHGLHEVLRARRRSHIALENGVEAVRMAEIQFRVFLVLTHHRPIEIDA